MFSCTARSRTFPSSDRLDAERMYRSARSMNTYTKGNHFATVTPAFIMYFHFRRAGSSYRIKSRFDEDLLPYGYHNFIEGNNTIEVLSQAQRRIKCIDNTTEINLVDFDKVNVHPSVYYPARNIHEDEKDPSGNLSSIFADDLLSKARTLAKVAAEPPRKSEGSPN
jgi:hypothetical protein